MEWHYANHKGEIIDNPTTKFQVDSVGNIIQETGGVIPKACQQCKSIFSAIQQQVPKTQPVKQYECTICDFKSTDYFEAVDHTVVDTHKLKITQVSKVVGYDTKLVGKLAKIVKTEDDCIILCQDCEDDF